MSKPFRILALLFVFPLSAVAALAQGPTTKADKLDGTWLPINAELSGQTLPQDFLKTIKLVIAGKNYTANVGEVLDKGTVQIDAAKKPRALDILGGEGPNKGKTFLAIYELKGDTLRICYDLLGKNRPTEFATKKGAPQFLVTYRRAKS